LKKLKRKKLLKLLKPLKKLLQKKKQKKLQLNNNNLFITAESKELSAQISKLGLWNKKR